jgi:hypothetical protein
MRLYRPLLLLTAFVLLCRTGQTTIIPAPQKTAPVSPLGADASCLNGIWFEQYANPMSWRFTVTGNYITLMRMDGFVAGTFVRNGNVWTGKLVWGDPAGTITSNMQLTPDADCSAVRTNQSWWYHR